MEPALRRPAAAAQQAASFTAHHSMAVLQCSLLVVGHRQSTLVTMLLVSCLCCSWHAASVAAESCPLCTVQLRHCQVVEQRRGWAPVSYLSSIYLLDDDDQYTYSDR
jgi:hypothetical protein